jgi:hypothetical protein
MLAPVSVFAVGAKAGAAPLPAPLANRINPLQRAAWACESGAPALLKTPQAATRSTGRQRFFLSSADISAQQTAQPSLRLQGGHLRGVGRLADDRGWSNIRFDCTLSQDLRQASAFTFQMLSAIPDSADSTPPPQPSVLKAADADRMRWYVDGAGPLRLVHGIKETDNRDFVASCVKGSGTIKVALTQTTKWLHAGNYVTVGIASGAGSGLYIGIGVADDNTGAALPVLSVETVDPLLGWLASGKSLLINLGGELVYEVALTGSGPAASAFRAACRA